MKRYSYDGSHEPFDLTTEVPEVRRRLPGLGWLAIFSFGAVTLAMAWGIAEVSRLVAELPSSQEALGQLQTTATPVSEIFDRHGRKIGEFAGRKSYEVSLAKVPEHVVQAFLAAEDRSFFDHHGVSLVAVARAAIANLRGREIRQGASTITQQLVRMTLLHRRQEWSRKIKEIILAVAVERRLSKERILELYLNQVFLGNRSYGIEAAARNYFRKSVAELNVGEAALLAALPKAPSRLAPNRYPGRASIRQEWVLSQMAANGWIDKDEAREWAEHAVEVYESIEDHYSRAPYFIEEVKREFSEKFLLNDAAGRIVATDRSYKIYTTLDLEVQNAVEGVLRQQVAAVNKRAGSSRAKKKSFQGAWVSIDPRSGEVVALQGGERFAQSQFNRALRTRRQIGGLMLPIVAAAALETGYTLTTKVPSDQLQKQHLRVASRQKRPLTLYEMVVEDRQLSSARLYQQLGAGTVRRLATDLGLHFTRRDLMVGRGYGRATPLEVASAYGAFAAGGRKVAPWLIQKVVNHKGEVAFERETSQGTLGMQRSSAAILSTVLSHYDASSRKRASSQKFTWSGVTDDMQNAWLVGSNPQLTSVFWLGTENGMQKLPKPTDKLRDGMEQAYYRAFQQIPEAWQNHGARFPGHESLSFGRHPYKFRTAPTRRMIPYASGGIPQGPVARSIQGSIQGSTRGSSPSRTF